MTLDRSSFPELNIETDSMCSSTTPSFRFRAPHANVQTLHSTGFGSLFVAYRLNIVYRHSPSGPVDPLFQTLPESSVKISLFFGTDDARLVVMDGPPSCALRGRPLHPRRGPGWSAASPPQDVPRVHVQPERRKEQVHPPQQR